AWANGQTFEAAAKLTSEQLHKDLGSSYRSVKGTLVHIVGAEWIWLRRWLGTSPKALLDPAEFSSVEEIKNRREAEEQERKEFLSTLTENSLKKPLSYTNIKSQPFSYPLWQALQHLVNHSTYHRGQVTTLLRQLGAQPKGTDLLIYYDAKFGQR
ncbi:MAG: DinB family protein, partial [Thermodesulfobacteriota bacterium]